MAFSLTGGAAAEVNGVLPFSVSATVNGLPVADGTTVTLSAAAGNLRSAAPSTRAGLATTDWLPTSVGASQISASLAYQGLSASAVTTLYAIPVRAPLELLVPAYQYPTTGTMWADLASASALHPELKISAIMNPPSNGEFTQADSSYVHAAEAFQAAGGKLVAYVHAYALNAQKAWVIRPIADIKANIDAYFRLYPTLRFTGIFVDQMWPTAQESFYQDLYNYVKSKSASLRVYGNPGTIPPSAFDSAADVLVLFEDQTGTVQQSLDFAGANSWVYARQNVQNAVLPYNISTCSAMQSTMKSMATAQYNIGVIYITDGLSDPWGALPSYWLKMLDDTRTINSGGEPSPC